MQRYCQQSNTYVIITELTFHIYALCQTPSLFQVFALCSNGKVRSSSFYHANLKLINFFDTKVSNESELCYFVWTCTQDKNTEK